MSVRIEFYGIPRERAGVGAIELSGVSTLGDVLRTLTTRLPALAAHCFEHDRMKAGYLANLNGESFTTDPAFPVRAGDAVLILSADAGG